MSVYSTSELKQGLKVTYNGEPFAIVTNEFVKPGKGQAFNRIKIRNLKTGRVIEITLKSGDTLEGADAKEVEVQYLYNDGDYWHFMDPASYEQYTVSKNSLGEAGKWIKEQDVCRITVLDGIPVSVDPPVFVSLKVTDTDNTGARGDTATGGSKPATLETGAVVRVPFFVKIGDLLKIDTRTGEYVSRAKE